MSLNDVGALRVVGGGIDSLDLFWLAPLSLVDFRALEELQRQAKDTPRGATLPSVRYGEEVLFMKPNPSRVGPLLLDNDRMSVVLNDRPLKNMPTAMISLKAFYLWQVGADKAVASAQAVMFDLATDEADDAQLTPHVTGIDLCVDYQGWEVYPEDLTPRAQAKGRRGDSTAWNERLYTRSRKYKLEMEAGRFESIAYGNKSSGLSAMIYNKTLELEESQKDWFEEVWNESGVYRPKRPVLDEDGEPMLDKDGDPVLESDDVIRVEVRIKRKGLVEFMREGAIENLDTWEQVRTKLSALWSYFSENWLVMRGARTKSDRLANAIDPAWSHVVEGRNHLQHEGTGTVLRRKLTKAGQRCTAAAAGYLVQLHACYQWHARDQSRTFEQNLSSILEGIRKYMGDKEWDPDERTRERYLKEWTAMEHVQYYGEPEDGAGWGEAAVA